MSTEQEKDGNEQPKKPVDTGMCGKPENQAGNGDGGGNGKGQGGTPIPEETENEQLKKPDDIGQTEGKWRRFRSWTKQKRKGLKKYHIGIGLIVGVASLVIGLWSIFGGGMAENMETLLTNDQLNRMVQRADHNQLNLSIGKLRDKERYRLEEENIWIADSFLVLGEYSEALNVLSPLVVDNPKVTILRIQLGYAHFGLSQFKQATKEWKEVVRHETNSIVRSMAYNNLGVGRYREREYKDAEDLFLKALRADPLNSKAKENLAEARRALETSLKDYR